MKRPSLLVLAACAACATTPHRPGASSDRYVITASRIYVSPEQAPLDHAWVEIAGDRIVAVGTGSPPAGRRDDRCSGGVLVAGFHNSHVHFTAPAFEGAATKPAAALEPALAELSTKWGFTTVTDTASNPADTVPLRERISRGELRGPTIYTVGQGLYAGIPFYLADLPPAVLEQLPRPKTAEEARRAVQQNLAAAVDAIKLFSATPKQPRGEIERMPPDVLAAAVDETHRAGKLVMVHPTDAAGVAAAAEAGVDIIVHTTIDPNPSIWPPELVSALVQRHIALVPTLKLWTYELAKAHVPAGVVETIERQAEAQLSAFANAGGLVLFGTDAGYMTDLDPTDEYVRMAEAGLTPMQILASLTTNPAARWNATETRGRVASGLVADLAVLDGDPATSVRSFAAVKCSIRAGRQVFVRGGR